MSRRSLTAAAEIWPFAGTFTISRGSRTATTVVVAEITDGAVTGRGECVPYPHYGESVEGVTAAIEGLAGAVADGLDREQLRDTLPPGAARNAVDCALWDIEAKASGEPVWRLAGLAAPGSLVTAYSIGIDTPEAMAAAARANASRPLLKVKLDGNQVIERMAAVHDAAPQARLVVDANEGWTLDLYREVAPRLTALGVEMIEQPLPAGQDAGLASVDRPITVCADESCHDRSTIADLGDRYDMINIKLDKTGGLTEALALADTARAAGLEIMVGCMIGTSLGMAPAMLVAARAAVVDLDGPLILATDRTPGITFRESVMEPAPAALWG